MGGFGGRGEGGGGFVLYNFLMGGGALVGDGGLCGWGFFVGEVMGKWGIVRKEGQWAVYMCVYVCV